MLILLPELCSHLKVLWVFKKCKLYSSETECNSHLFWGDTGKEKVQNDALPKRILAIHLEEDMYIFEVEEISTRQTCRTVSEPLWRIRKLLFWNWFIYCIVINWQIRRRFAASTVHKPRLKAKDLSFGR